MECKADNPIRLLAGEDQPALIQAYFELCHLKQLYRQGWLRRGVPKARCESVAEHSFAVTVLALWLAEAYFPDLDREKVLRMALLHDFGEVYAGDIIPNDGVSPEEKQRREEQSAIDVFAKLPGGEIYTQLWREFETGVSLEARFVRQIDRLEMGFQAGLYQRQGFGRLSEFFVSAREALQDNELIELLDAVSEKKAALEIELRPFQRSDFPRLISWTTSAEFLLQWAGMQFDYPLEERQLEDYLNSAAGDPPKRKIFTVLNARSGEHIGHIELNKIDLYNRCATISRVLVGEPSARGQGVAEEMMRHALGYGFDQLGLHRIDLNVFDFNLPAIRCYEKLGFVLEGLVRDVRRFGDEYWSVYRMSLLEDEWRRYS
jgi:putative hydrolase of HD superfamily